MNLSKLKKDFFIRPAFSEALIVLFLFGVALFWRFHRITELPEDFSREQASFFAYTGLIHLGVSSLPEEVLRLTPLATTFPLCGLSSLLAYRIFGTNFLATSAPLLLVDSLGCVLAYLFFRDMFSKRVGFFAAFFLATSYWAVSMARVGADDFFLEGTLMTAFCWFLYRLAKHEAPANMHMAGAVFALMLFCGYWYFAGFALLIGAAFLGTSLKRGWFIQNRREILKSVGLSLGTYAFLVLVASYFLRVQNPLGLPVESLRFALWRSAATASGALPLEENLKRVVRDMFVGAPGDSGGEGWCMDGQPWLPVILSVMLVISLMSSLSFSKLTQETKLLLLWILIPLGTYVGFYRTYAIRCAMFAPAVMACCALGVDAVAHWMESREGGRRQRAERASTTRILSMIFCGFVTVGVASDSYHIYFQKFFNRCYGDFPRAPVRRLAEYLEQNGMGPETLFVTNLEVPMQWTFRVYMGLPSQPLLSLENVAGWPAGWEKLTFEKGWRRIVYIFAAYPDMRFFEEYPSRRNRPSSERRVRTIFFSDRVHNFWMRRSFASEEIRILPFKSGYPAFHVIGVPKRQARRGSLSFGERQRILQGIPAPPLSPAAS